jgi:tetratricopeptide (TPR) repeat protein
MRLGRRKWKKWKVLTTCAALGFLCAALLAGCASAPKEDTEAERTSRIQTDLRIAESLTELGSPQSLSKAAQVLGTDELKGEAGAAQLSSFAARLWGVLYPDMHSPFPSASQASAGALAEAAPSDSAFFQRLGPALALLTPGPAPDEAQAAGMLNGLDAANHINGDSVLPPYLKALLLSRQDAPAQSVRQLYEECLRRDSSFYPAKTGLIDTAIAEGSAAADQAVLLKNANELPTPLAVASETATIFLAAGKPQQAADAAAKALILAPDSTDLLLLRARAFDAMGDWYGALSILDALLTLAPGNGPALAMKATILFEKGGDPDGAMKILSEVDGKFPGDPAFPELRGRILISRGNSVEGEAALKEALTIDPNRVSTLGFLAQVSARAGRWQEADAYLQRIPEQERTTEMLQTEWEIALNLAEYDRALALAQVLEKRTSADAALLYRVRTLAAADRTQDAQALATRDLGTATTPAVRASLYFLRAQAARRAGGSPDAVLADLRAALRENPDDLDAILALSDSLSSAGDYRKALAYLRHAQELSPEDADIRARINTATRLAQPEN